MRFTVGSCSGVSVSGGRGGDVLVCFHVALLFFPARLQSGI